MAYFDKDAKTEVIADASPVGLGAILTQEQQGAKCVVTYPSRSLSDVECRYFQRVKEALGLVWACECFHIYLHWIDFKLLTDHKPLEVIYSSKSKPSARIQHWVLRLQPYCFKAKHVPGCKNVVDTLSHLTQTNERSRRNIAEEYVHFLAEIAAPKAVPIQEIECQLAQVTELSMLRECIHLGDWSKCTPAYKVVCYELSVLGKLVLRGKRIIIPEKLQKHILDLAHKGHQGVVKMKQRLHLNVWWPGIDRGVEPKYAMDANW